MLLRAAGFYQSRHVLDVQNIESRRTGSPLSSVQALHCLQGNTHRVREWTYYPDLPYWIGLVVFPHIAFVFQFSFS